MVYRLAGMIRDNVAVVAARVKNGKLVFARRGEFRFVVDTGFTGDLMIPQKLVEPLDLEFLGYKTFQLAAENVIALPVYRGYVTLGKATLEVEMTPGDALIGMTLLRAIGSQLHFDFHKATIVLK